MLLSESYLIGLYNVIGTSFIKYACIKTTKRSRLRLYKTIVTRQPGELTSIQVY